MNIFHQWIEAIKPKWLRGSVRCTQNNLSKWYKNAMMTLGEILFQGNYLQFFHSLSSMIILPPPPLSLSRSSFSRFLALPPSRSLAFSLSRPLPPLSQLSITLGRDNIPFSHVIWCFIRPQLMFMYFGAFIILKICAYGVYSLKCVLWASSHQLFNDSLPKLLVIKERWNEWDKYFGKTFRESTRLGF